MGQFHLVALGRMCHGLAFTYHFGRCNFQLYKLPLTVTWTSQYLYFYLTSHSTVNNYTVPFRGRRPYGYDHCLVKVMRSMTWVRVPWDWPPTRRLWDYVSIVDFAPIRAIAHVTSRHLPQMISNQSAAHAMVPWRAASPSNTRTHVSWPLFHLPLGITHEEPHHAQSTPTTTGHHGPHTRQHASARSGMARGDAVLHITSRKKVGWEGRIEATRAESQWIVAARPLCHLQYPVAYLSRLQRILPAAQWGIALQGIPRGSSTPRGSPKARASGGPRPPTAGRQTGDGHTHRFYPGF
ncbi:unnamed protein product [Lupinus luteus]|uniref:Uncharacterized protein n=1 Tax=Lupinus luteus TaxID=3873 RepID=A0AAV1VYX9_LUPLU